MNAFESGDQKMIPAVLLYAFHENKVLMIHRDARPGDFHEGKWNGLGGKVERAETYPEAAAREFREESGIVTHPLDWNWLGQLHFPNFKPKKKEDWLVNVYTVELTAEQAEKITGQEKRDEGTLHWIEKTKVTALNLWDGDRHFLPLVLQGKRVQGTLFYEEGICARVELHSIQ